MSFPPCKTLRLVLGDQLDSNHSWFSQHDDDVLYVLAELRQEATYVTHHIQKVLSFFIAMQRFAGELEAAGHRVLRLDLDATAGYADLPALLAQLLSSTGAQRFEYQRPDEYRLLVQLQQFCEQLDLDHACCESEHFLVPYAQLTDYLPAGKQLRMEHFYRRIRRETGWLMDAAGEPRGGRWNFDADNRKAMPGDVTPPEPLAFSNAAGDALRRLQRHRIATIGRLTDEQLDWPLDRKQSLQLLAFFVEQLLPQFGQYQDALTGRSWSLFHSRLSFALNSKLLSPREVVEAVLAASDTRPERYPLASIEGFVRQIIGWREFMRGIYWLNMPDYERCNELQHERALPAFYWTGETRMACMAQAIGQSLEQAYAHHIQRLMVTGNFALLAGVHPDAVDEWYLGIYIDALQWVELPNTRGMSQWADGGLVASKPYVSSGNYINKMGDHCRECHYDVKQRTGPRACPFNALYWHFMERHRRRLERNPRIGMVYRSWDRMAADQRQALLDHAETLLGRLDEL